jgi:hypothetical protein
MRLDGDMHEWTMDGLRHLYQRVSQGDLSLRTTTGPWKAAGGRWRTIAANTVYRRGCTKWTTGSAPVSTGASSEHLKRSGQGSKKAALAAAIFCHVRRIRGAPAPIHSIRSAIEETRECVSPRPISRKRSMFLEL